MVPALKAAVVALPLLIVVLWNFRRWRRHYGSGTIGGYWLRFSTARTATDDTTIIYIAKMAVCLAWAAATIPLLDG